MMCLFSLAYISLLYCTSVYIMSKILSRYFFVFCCCNKHAYTCRPGRRSYAIYRLVYSVNYIDIVDKEEYRRVLLWLSIRGVTFLECFI